jgi:cytoskeletal protein CcmA (bactofilin family)
MMKRNSTQADGPDRLNVLVEGTRIKGDLIADSSLRIDGEVTGNVASSSKVVIGKNGLLMGDLNCADADLEGRVEGKIWVEGLLSLRSSAVVKGDIHCLRLQIEEGANFTGSCIMGGNLKNVSQAIASEADMVY